VFGNSSRSATEVGNRLAAEQTDDVKPRRRVSRWMARQWQRFVLIVLVGLVIGVLVASALFNRIVYYVESGEAAVLYKTFEGGTQTDIVYGEGFHFVMPYNILYSYDVRIQTALHRFAVLTNKGLPIHLNLAVRFHPQYATLGLLHQRVGPDYVDAIVIPQIESVLRRNIGQHDPEDIYTNKAGILTDIIARAIEETGQKFVFIDDIIIRNVELPEDVEVAIEEKLVFEQQWKAYEFRLALEEREAERKRTEARGIRDFHKTINETLSDRILIWQDINATHALAESDNAKIVILPKGNANDTLLTLDLDGVDMDEGQEAPSMVRAPVAPYARTQSPPAADHD